MTMVQRVLVEGILDVLLFVIIGDFDVPPIGFKIDSLNLSKAFVFR